MLFASRARIRRFLEQFALLGAIALAAGAASAQVDTLILRSGDDTPLQPIDRVWEIGEQHGVRPGGAAGTNLLHSFERFDVGGGDTALFTANPLLTTRNVIARVNGGESPSLIFGTLASDIDGADLYLLNPNGILFGRDATLDLKGSFFASSADTLRLFDDTGASFEAFSNEAPLLSATPQEFGFLGDPATIEVRGSQLAVAPGEAMVTSTVEQTLATSFQVMLSATKASTYPFVVK